MFILLVLINFRFIIHNDATNPYMDSLEQFTEELKSFKPSLLAVGGLQMLENFPFQEGTFIFHNSLG